MLSKAIFFAGLSTLVLGQNSTKPGDFDPFSASARCPFPCSEDRTSWALHHDTTELQACNKTVLMDLNLYNKDTNPTVAIRACAVQGQPSIKLSKRQQFVPSSLSNNTQSPFDLRNQTADIDILRHSGPHSNSTTPNGTLPASTSDILAAAAALAEHLKSEPNGKHTSLFSKSGNAIFGVYAGEQIDMKSAGSIVQEFAKRVTGTGFDQAAAQLCSSGSLSTQIFGIFLETTDDLTSVQEAIRDWNDAKCIADSWGTKTVWKNAPLVTIPGREVQVGPNTSDNHGNLDKRDTCSYTQVVAGDGCDTLTQRCNISQDELLDYNHNPNLCSTLKVGQYVCCSSGDLPDFSPKPNPDGSCKTYTIAEGDSCSAVAEKNQIEIQDIEDRNKKTWGWAGCSYLLPGQVICLSTGSQPMPASVENAVCGPQVPGTKKPDNMDDLASLNPCPLKACCNVWGQCGTTKDFCIPAPADTGSPGTSKPGANGCIFNCGMDIVNNKNPPAQFKRLGYFEAWNADRPCLHMRPRQIDTNKYTHIHFAFATISDDFDVKIDQQQMFTEFKALSGVKKIMSFGGWSFSTEADTFPIFREGVTPEQRQKFANSVVKFVADNGLDGVDFDWEYPGAPDIPGIPPGSPNDGPNYLAFLKLVRDALPKEKTVAIAAPASYWYLKGFPIEEIGKVVDYIVYMTYDIHGQWDFGNGFSDEGCPTGDCLRSHVNRTETENAMSMITKAGVQADKILIGMALYGRSFQMTTPGCWGPECKYTGPSSGATPGRCTETRSYISNFEIREIISSKGGVQQFSDNADGDIIVYDNVQWVSYLTKPRYDGRVNWVRGLNFGGTSDWAIDLDADYGENDGPGGGDSGSGPVLLDPGLYTSQDPTIQCNPQCTFVFPPMTLPTPTTIVPDPETITYEENWSTTITVSGAVITTSAASIATTVITHPPVTTTVISIWDVTWSGSTIDQSSHGIINLTMSVDLPPQTLTYTNTHDTTSSGVPILFTYSPGPWPPIPPTTTPPGGNNPTTTPIPPPPPPPTGFPPSVTVKPGPPKPTCTSNCPKPCSRNCDPGSSHCIGICGCIGPFCPKPPGCPLCPPGGCIGPGCSDGGGGGGGGGENDPSSCRTRTTVSTCEVDCTVKSFPGTTTTTCDKPACSRTITACSTTGTTSTTTTTISCASQPPYPNFGPNDRVPRIGDGGLGGIVVDPGEFTSMPPPATSTKPPSNDPPLPTFAPGKGNPYCFRDHNGNGQYHKFGEDAGDSTIASVCNNGDVLPPSNTFGFASRGQDNLLVSVTWAKDQSGCPAKKDVPMRDFCTDTYREIILTCDKAIVTDTYGGAFVESNTQFGCVRWWIGTSPTSLRAAEAFALDAPSNGTNSTVITNPTQQQMISEWLDGIEDELPMMRRPKSNGTRVNFAWEGGS
ncbi:hypothetical protein EJ04DRAFT_492871 [Polyplosphaeria fusca]|uniref:chitinase n=1 Tax=Polyplosphaeria fusca TaxID=682080 RepID=A0A9P4QVS3_9PLEO|nr:hypothetical protein EJ04DRAFT_492871 [Polyplosphaeria fusca]